MQQRGRPDQIGLQSLQRGSGGVELEWRPGVRWSETARPGLWPMGGRGHGCSAVGERESGGAWRAAAGATRQGPLERIRCARGRRARSSGRGASYQSIAIRVTTRANGFRVAIPRPDIFCRPSPALSRTLRVIRVLATRLHATGMGSSPSADRELTLSMIGRAHRRAPWLQFLR